MHLLYQNTFLTGGNERGSFGGAMLLPDAYLCQMRKAAGISFVFASDDSSEHHRCVFHLQQLHQWPGKSLECVAGYRKTSPWPDKGKSFVLDLTENTGRIKIYEFSRTSISWTQHSRNKIVSGEDECTLLLTLLLRDWPHVFFFIYLLVEKKKGY